MNSALKTVHDTCDTAFCRVRLDRSGSPECNGEPNNIRHSLRSRSVIRDRYRHSSLRSLRCPDMPDNESIISLPASGLWLEGDAQPRSHIAHDEGITSFLAIVGCIGTASCTMLGTPLTPACLPALAASLDRTHHDYSASDSAECSFIRPSPRCNSPSVIPKHPDVIPKRRRDNVRHMVRGYLGSRTRCKGQFMHMHCTSLLLLSYNTRSRLGHSAIAGCFSPSLFVCLIPCWHGCHLLTSAPLPRTCMLNHARSHARSRARDGHMLTSLSPP